MRPTSANKLPTPDVKDGLLIKCKSYNKDTTDGLTRAETLLFSMTTALTVTKLHASSSQKNRCNIKSKAQASEDSSELAAQKS
jgi:hypothetical protein